MKTKKNLLILGVAVAGLAVVALTVFSAGTDTNSNAVTETVTEAVTQPAATANPSTAPTSPAIGGDVNAVETTSDVNNANEVDNNSAK